MTIRTRLAVLASLPVAFALMVGAALWLTGQRVDEARLLADFANDVIDANTELNILAQEYLLYGEARPVVQWRTRHGSLGRLIARAPDSPAERELWQELERDYNEIAKLFVQLVQQPAAPRVIDWRQRVASQLLIKSEDMRSRARELVETYEQQLMVAQRRSDAVILSLLTALALVTAAMSTVLGRRLNRSLSRLMEGVSRIGAGDLRREIALTSSDELGELATAFNGMTRRLRESYASLGATEKRYRNLFENMADGYALHEIILDANGIPRDYRFIDINPAFERTLGLSRADVVGKTAREIMPEIEAYWIEAYGRVALTGEPARFEQYASRFGRRFEVSATSPQRGLLAVMFVDVTEHRKAEEALRAREEQLNSLFNSAPAGMLVLDRDFRYVRINELLAAVNGLTVAEHLGKTVREVVPQVWPKVEGLFRRVLNGETLTNIEVSVKPGRDPEETLHWMASYFPIRGREEQIVGLGGVLIDITERKLAEAERDEYRQHLEELVRARTNALERQAQELEAANTKLRELDRLKSMFIASMSHELRTPLNSIIGFTGIILQGMAGEVNAEQRNQLTMVKESGAHLLSLVNDIIDISKIEAGNVEVSIEPFDLIKVVNEVVDSVSVALRTKGIALTVVAPNEMSIESDRRRVRQILINLVGNAIKFTDHGGVQITVCATPEPGGIEIAVRDTGIGIAKEDMGKLFTAFTQIVTEGRPKEGSGLGLYLSHKIAALLGGCISVQSELGVGSTFTVWLPSKARTTQ